MNATNYHNENAEFKNGQTVTHVTDDGEMVKAKITATNGDLLHLEFEDGADGWEKATTCF